MATEPNAWAVMMASLDATEIADNGLKPLDHTGQPAVVQRVGRISRPVIVGIAKRSCVRNHDPGIALPPERPLVRPADPVDKLGRGHPLASPRSGTKQWQRAPESLTSHSLQSPRSHPWRDKQIDW